MCKCCFAQLLNFCFGTEKVVILVDFKWVELKRGSLLDAFQIIVILRVRVSTVRDLARNKEEWNDEDEITKVIEGERM